MYVSSIRFGQIHVGLVRRHVLGLASQSSQSNHLKRKITPNCVTNHD